MVLEAGPAGNHIDNSFLEGLAVDGFVSLGFVCRLIDVMDLATEFLAAPVSRSDVGEPLCISPDKRCATPWVAELDTSLVICAALKDSLLAVALVSDCTSSA